MGVSHAVALILLATSLIVASASVLKVTPSESLPNEDLIQSDIISDQTEVKDLLFQDIDLSVETSHQDETEDPQIESQDLENEEQTRTRKVFVIMHEKRNWFEALYDCEKLGKNLATIRSDEEQKALEQLMQNEGVKDEDLWLGGGHDMFQEGQTEWGWWVGSHYEPFTYTHWGEPSNYHGIFQQCLQILGSRNSFWDDIPCWYPDKFVCEDNVKEEERSFSKSAEEKSRQSQDSSVREDEIQPQIIALIPIDITGLSDGDLTKSDIVSDVGKTQDHQIETQDLQLNSPDIQPKAQDLPLKASYQNETEDPQTISQDLQNEEKTRPQKVFVIMHEKLNWFQARKGCEKLGKNLATIRSDEEQKALEQLMQNQGMINEHLWLAGHDLFEVGKEGWSWRVGSTDEPFTYTHWGEGEPNNWNGIPQHCLQIRGSHNYFWDDFQCSELLEFVCENKVSEDERSLSKSTEGKTCQTQVSCLPDDVIQAQTVGLTRLQTTVLTDSSSELRDVISVINEAQGFKLEVQGLKLESQGLKLEVQGFKLESHPQPKAYDLQIEGEDHNPEANDCQHEVQVLQTPEVQTRPNKVFVIMHEKLSWNGASRRCEESGMNLATIQSEEEQKRLEEMLKKKGLTEEDLWLGGYELWDTRNKVWSWRIDSRDEPFTYTNWDEGEPNDYNMNQRCLQIRPASGYRWDNVECSDFQGFLCETLSE